MIKIKDRNKILLAIKKSGFKLVKNIIIKKYYLISDYYNLVSDERLVK